MADGQVGSMPVKIPKSVKIKDQVWKIKFVSKLQDDSGDDCLGLCDFSERVILMLKGQSKSAEAQTFMHEIIHASFYELHVVIPEEIEEVLCDGLGYILTNSFSVCEK